MATPIMILGCTSDAGKSFLVTALCRFFANRHHFLKQLGWHGQSGEEWSSTLDIHIEHAAQLISESGWKI